MVHNTAAQGQVFINIPLPSDQHHILRHYVIRSEKQRDRLTDTKTQQTEHKKIQKAVTVTNIKLQLHVLILMTLVLHKSFPYSLKALQLTLTLILSNDFERRVGSLMSRSDTQLTHDAVRFTNITNLHRCFVVAIRTHQNDNASSAAGLQQQLKQCVTKVTSPSSPLQHMNNFITQHLKKKFHSSSSSHIRVMNHNSTLTNFNFHTNCN